MSEPFLGEICIVGFNFAPRGYAFCDGQILPINQNQSLYSILGTTYGGDGRTSFALPDLRGRTPIHEGTGNGANHPLGQKGGAETVPLTVAEMPSHSHPVRGTSDVGAEEDPSGALPCQAQHSYMASPGTLVNMEISGSPTITATGSNQGHPNMQPFLTLNFVIALQGLFPSRN